MPVFSLLEDNTVIDDTGRVISVGPKLLESLLTDGRRCVVCCNEGETNQEHIIPNWLLRASGSHEEAITAHSERLLRLASYKITICQSCNTIMGQTLEEPVSAAFRNGYLGVAALAEENPALLCSWISWVFFKNYLRDRSLSVHLDIRKGEAKFGDQYNWGAFSRILAFARAPFSGVKIQRSAIGTMKIFRIIDHKEFHAFNYADNPNYNLLFIRLNDCAVVASLCDGGAVDALLEELFLSAGPNLTQFQLIEILAEIQFAGMRLGEAPGLDFEGDPATREAILERTPSGRALFRSTTKAKRDEIFRYNMSSYLVQKMKLPAIREIFRKVSTDNFSFIPYLDGRVRNFPEVEIFSK